MVEETEQRIKDVEMSDAGVGVKSDKEEQLTGRWTPQEHRLFLRGLEMHGRDNKKIAALIKSRNVDQARTHAQKHFQKLAKKEAPPPQLLDPFYQARANKLEGTAPGPNCHVPDWRRKRGERAQESKEAKKARLENDRQRYHDRRVEEREVELYDNGVPKL